MCETLQRDDTRRVAWSFVIDRVNEGFGDLAEERFDIAVSRGRHANRSGRELDQRLRDIDR